MRHALTDFIGWGLGLWVIGYLLGILFFMIVPPELIGWAITPIGIAVTLWVLLKKVKRGPRSRYFLLACAWTGIAIVCDYFFIVRLFKPADGYYKLDVYLYYILTFFLPLLTSLKLSQKAVPR